MNESSKSVAQPAIEFLGVGRAILGLATIIAPIASCNLFRIPISPPTAMIARMFGAREVAIGMLLCTAENRTDTEMKELKRSLWAGVAVDAMDVGCCTYAFATGQLGRIGFGLLGGSAAAVFGIGLLTLRKVNAEKKGGSNEKKI